MKIKTLSGVIDTQELYNKACNNLVKIEELLRTSPYEICRYPIGYLLPLGTLGNARDKKEQFKSNFNIVAYTLPDYLRTNYKDFEDLNITDPNEPVGQIVKDLQSQLNAIAGRFFGKNWTITMFNSSLSMTIESMHKTEGQAQLLKKNADELLSIVQNRVRGLGKSVIPNNADDSNEINLDKVVAHPHEVVEFTYQPFRAMSLKIKPIKADIDSSKKIYSSSTKKMLEIQKCDELLIETMIYDNWANGLRLLSNIESFISTVIRSNTCDHAIVLALKARKYEEDPYFVPIRQFSGESKIATTDISSGCTERIIYNTVNKNYRFWSFLSLPIESTINLDSVN